MKIEFIPTKPFEHGALLKPEPASKHLPDWYKKMRPFTGGKKEHEAYANNTKNVTIKWCNPFGDALTAGYFILLENDVQIKQTENGPSYVWFRGGDDFISSHSKDQISPDLIPDGYGEDPMKFINPWGIKTPPGYSTLFTHPLNRTELPFLTLNGVVDTDDYNQPVNFPFLLKEGYEGIIEAGTPIAQVIPFKREVWQAEYANFDPIRTASLAGNYLRKIFRPYKLGYWKRKEYK